MQETGNAAEKTILERCQEDLSYAAHERARVKAHVGSMLTERFERNEVDRSFQQSP